MKKKSNKPKFTGKPKAGKRMNAGPKLEGFLRATKKKTEPDNPILKPQSMPAKSSPNPGAKASASKARLSRLKDVRI